MKVVIKRVGQMGEVIEVENTLETWNDIVGGWIQTYPLDSDMLIICNEEVKLMGLEPNIRVITDRHTEVIVGDIAIVKGGYEDFESLEDKHLSKLRESGLIK